LIVAPRLVPRPLHTATGEEHIAYEQNNKIYITSFICSEAR
jgi:hypothetical protein